MIATIVGCANEGPNGPSSPSSAAASRDPAYRALVALLPRVDGIADLIPQLDDELRSNFTFVFASRSPLRGIDRDHPRAILSSRDARLVVSFTGDGPDRDVLEVIHFRDDRRAFELERYVLPAAARRDPELASLARDNGRPDPGACTSCHGADPRPIIDSYFVWPGFYGSVQDRFLAGSDELTSYRRFLGTVADPASAYHALRYPSGSPVPPYFLDPALVESSQLALAPNTRLGMALTELNRKRIARELEASPHYTVDRDKLIAGLLGCEPMPIDDADRARVKAAVVAENADKLDRAGIFDAATREDLEMAEVTSIENLAELDYVARALEVSRADWSMALDAGSLALYDGILSGGVGTRDFYFKEDVLFELMRAADVPASFAIDRYFRHEPFGTRLDLPRAIAACATFAARARAMAMPSARPSAPQVAYRCVRCHADGGGAPAIPFDLPARLAAVLAARPELAAGIAARIDPATDATHRMPLDRPALSTSERAALSAYIASLR